MHTQIWIETWWSHNVFGNVRKELNRKKKLLIEEEAMAVRSGDNTCVRSLKLEINTLLDHEIRMWKQQSWILWLSKGDDNIKYFHTRASHHFKRNSLVGIYNSANVWTENMEEIPEAFTSHRFLSKLFTTSNPSLLNSVLDHIPKVITEEMNCQLMNEFSVGEVSDALKQMGPLKASCPDGMPPMFFQRLWPMVEGDITNSVLSWLNSSTLPHPLNHTHITLNPKKTKS